MKGILVATGWVVCSVLAYGLTLADLEPKDQPYIDDASMRHSVAFAVLIGLCGPVGFIIAIFASGFATHGLRWR